jgi:hypothetical protein
MRLILAVVLALVFGNVSFAQNQNGKVMPSKVETKAAPAKAFSQDCPNGKCPLQAAPSCPNCPQVKSAACPQGCASSCTSCKSTTSKGAKPIRNFLSRLRNR